MIPDCPFLWPMLKGENRKQLSRLCRLCCHCVTLVTCSVIITATTGDPWWSWLLAFRKLQWGGACWATGLNIKFMLTLWHIWLQVLRSNTDSGAELRPTISCQVDSNCGIRSYSKCVSRRVADFEICGQNSFVPRKATSELGCWALSRGSADLLTGSLISSDFWGVLEIFVRNWKVDFLPHTYPIQKITKVICFLHHDLWGGVQAHCLKDFPPLQMASTSRTRSRPNMRPRSYEILVSEAKPGAAPGQETSLLDAVPISDEDPLVCSPRIAINLPNKHKGASRKWRSCKILVHLWTCGSCLSSCAHECPWTVKNFQ